MSKVTTYWESAAPLLVYTKFTTDADLRNLNNHLEAILPPKSKYSLIVEMTDKQHAEETVYAKNVVALKPSMNSMLKGLKDPYLLVVLKQKWKTLLTLSQPTALADKCFKATNYQQRVLFNVDEKVYPYDSKGKENHLVFKTKKTSPMDLVNFARQMTEKITIQEKV